VVAAVGIAIGAHQYTVAIGATTLIILTLFALRVVENAFLQRRVDRRYNVAVDPTMESLATVEEKLEGLGLRVRIEAIDNESDLFHLVIRAIGPLDGHDRAVRMMAIEPQVRSMGRG
jgi:uncharacterized membrane protein YhiD involved in acid resistance